VALESGATLGPYEIVTLLGRGGMGEVYRARDAKLRRDVAIKVLPANVAQDGDRGPLPLREALNIARQIAEGIEAAHQKMSSIAT
jgi:serine/threonine protein kinase